MTGPLAIFAGWLCLIKIWNLLAILQNYVVLVLQTGHRLTPFCRC